MSFIFVDEAVKKFLEGDFKQAESIITQVKTEVEISLVETGYVFLKTNTEIPFSLVYDVYLFLLSGFFNPVAVLKDGSLYANVKDKKDELIKSYSLNNTGFQFHTDGVYKTNTPEYVMMGCIEKARQGGDSIIINGHQLLEALKEKPAYYDTLINDSFFVLSNWDKEKPTMLSRKIIEVNEDSTLKKLCYFRNPMVDSNREAGFPLTKIQTEALNYFDMLCMKQLNNYRYTLESGEFIIVDNHKMLHGRLPFKDGDSGGRHIVRMWGNKKM